MSDPTPFDNSNVQKKGKKQRKRIKDPLNERYVHGFRVSRNYQTEQQGIMLGLLNIHYNLVIDHPQKRSLYTLPFLKINRLENNKQKVLFPECIDKKLKELYNKDLKEGVTDKTALRRQDVYRVAECLHLLIELTRKSKYHLVTKTTTGNKGNIKESIKQISFDGFVFDRNEISTKGRLVNKIITERLENQDRFNQLIIPRGDLEIMASLMCDS
ncbi:BAG domain-containing protein [Entamoeba marina]